MDKGGRRVHRPHTGPQMKTDKNTYTMLLHVNVDKCRRHHRLQRSALTLPSVARTTQQAQVYSPSPASPQDPPDATVEQPSSHTDLDLC